ncbi:MAG: hypothetical protein EOM68_28590 [Spirochaetia bacterium]|nr:hypothetical protein [Spirochaetia bacterium]
MAQVMNVCVTLNNPSFNAEDLVFSEEHVSYAVWQLEKGEEGTVHIQAYVELKKKARYAQIVQRIPQLAGAHFEKRRGTAHEASDYCEKEVSREAGE